MRYIGHSLMQVLNDVSELTVRYEVIGDLCPAPLLLAMAAFPESGRSDITKFANMTDR